MIQRRPQLVVDLRMVTPDAHHGIARYAAEWGRYLCQRSPAPVAITLLISPGVDPEAMFGPGAAELAVPCDLPWLSVAETVGLARTVKHLGGDLFHSTSFAAPLRMPCPVVLTLHDMNHLRFPSDYGWRQRLYYATCVRAAVSSAAAIVTVSEFSAREIAHFFPTAAGKTRVIPNGVDSLFEHASASAQRQQSDFVVLDHPKPHKNLHTLAAAWPRVQAQWTEARLHVVGDGVVSELSRDLDDRAGVTLHPPLPDHELAHLLGRCRALVYPTIYEGFGLPVLEAFAAGCEVIALPWSSLPEISAQLLCPVSENTPQGFADAILHLCRTPLPSLPRLEREGQLREVARRRTWAETGHRTWDLLATLLPAPSAKA